MKHNSDSTSPCSVTYFIMNYKYEFVEVPEGMYRVPMTFEDDHWINNKIAVRVDHGARFFDMDLSNVASCDIAYFFNKINFVIS